MRRSPLPSRASATSLLSVATLLGASGRLSHGREPDGVCRSAATGVVGRLVAHGTHRPMKVHGRNGEDLPRCCRYTHLAMTTFVAVVALQLAQEGRLDLDAGIDRCLPDLPGADRITPRQLLNHTRGLHGYSDEPAVVNDPLHK
jgi:D-alanyl-D-alanine carboxypeptidase